LRLVRRLIDGLILFAGLLFTLHHFGINLTATLAGLGVGGIAVALAAQKTLENVIAGVFLIADQAVRVGDVLSLGDVQGTVEELGLRSTRIRTIDRTVVSLPKRADREYEAGNSFSAGQVLVSPGGWIALRNNRSPVALFQRWRSHPA
jgi:small-conductance mechanosensitive channel